MYSNFPIFNSMIYKTRNVQVVPANFYFNGSDETLLFYENKPSKSEFVQGLVLHWELILTRHRKIKLELTGCFSFILPVSIHTWKRYYATCQGGGVVMVIKGLTQLCTLHATVPTCQARYVCWRTNDMPGGGSRQSAIQAFEAWTFRREYVTGSINLVRSLWLGRSQAIAEGYQLLTHC
jgi:hypothetical protein